MKSVNWSRELQPLIDKYAEEKHPLEYQNLYQLLVMVILSARDSDDHINKVAPELFRKYPDMAALAKAETYELDPILKSVRSSRKKIAWLMEIANELQSDSNIPTSMKELTDLKGVGRKTANVIKREAKATAEGIMVDLHVVRVAPRLGIVEATEPNKIEKELMEKLPKEMWEDIGMALSFLGRDVCRPTNPHHEECMLSHVCAYCRNTSPEKCE